MDFLGNCIAESTGYFFVVNLEFIYTSILEIKMVEKIMKKIEIAYIDLIFKFLAFFSDHIQNSTFFDLTSEFWIP